MNLKKWFDNKVGSKLQLYNIAKGFMSGGSLDMPALLELAKTFITPDTSEKISEAIAKFNADHAARLGVEEIAIIIRNTPDGRHAYIDVIQIENGEMVAALAQYSKKDLAQLLNTLNNEDAQKLLSELSTE